MPRQGKRDKGRGSQIHPYCLGLKFRAKRRNAVSRHGILYRAGVARPLQVTSRALPLADICQIPDVAHCYMPLTRTRVRQGDVPRVQFLTIG